MRNNMETLTICAIKMSPLTANAPSFPLSKPMMRRTLPMKPPSPLTKPLSLFPVLASDEDGCSSAIDSLSSASESCIFGRSRSSPTSSMSFSCIDWRLAMGAKARATKSATSVAAVSKPNDAWTKTDVSLLTQSIKVFPLRITEHFSSQIDSCLNIIH